MKPVLAAICVAVLAAGTLSACGEKSEPDLKSLAAQYRQQQEQAILGDYTGTLHQKGQKPFSVQATVASLNDPSKNTVHYTGIDCSGTWTYTKLEGGTYFFGERINKGKSDKCKGSGTVKLMPQGANQYDYVFNGDGVTSEGTLQRSG
jgi:hypothetical protein